MEWAGDSVQVEVIYPGPFLGIHPCGIPKPVEQELGTAKAKDVTIHPTFFLDLLLVL